MAATKILENPQTKIAITGASSGIGLALVQQVLSYPLWLSGRDLTKLSHLIKNNAKITLHQADLSTDTGIQSACDSLDEFAPDILIHCAGYTQYQFFHQRPLHSIQEEQKCLLDSTVSLAWHFIHQRRSLKKEGVCLIISSALAYLPSPAMAIYGASKTAVNSLAASLDAENKKDGIRVFVSCPGPVQTAFQSRASHGKYQHKDPSAISPEYAAKCLIQQIKNNKPIDNPGIMAKFACFVGRHLPWRWACPILIKRVKNRISQKTI